MKAVYRKLVITSLIATVCPDILAANAGQAQINWQMKAIYQPSAATLSRERQGFVNIYDGFTSAQVDRIMDEKYHRIQNMMFTRVKLTDSSGEPLVDPASGEELVEEDGCD